MTISDNQEGGFATAPVRMEVRNAYARIGPEYTATLPLRVIIATIGSISVFVVLRDGGVTPYDEDELLKHYSWECLPPQ